MILPLIPSTVVLTPPTVSKLALLSFIPSAVVLHPPAIDTLALPLIASTATLASPTVELINLIFATVLYPPALALAITTTTPGRDFLPRRPIVKKLIHGQTGNEGSGYWYEDADGHVHLDPGMVGTPTFPFGAVLEFGDGLTSGLILVGQQVMGRVIAPVTGVTLNSIRLDAKVAVTCQMDILLNGTSIFGAGSTKPNLAAGTTYHDVTFTGTVDLTWDDDDLLVGSLLSLTGEPLQLALTLQWE